MATELTTASGTSTVDSPSDTEFHPIDWWADLDPCAMPAEPQRHIPPIPAFVRLSRLIDPDQISSTRGSEPPTAFGPPVRFDGHAELSATEQQPVSRRRWADSAGRPLFRIGLLAIAAAVVIAVATFVPSEDDLATVESPETAISVGPGSGSMDADQDAAATEEQAHRVLEALIRQTSAGPEADLSIVGTASGDRSEVRWTATIRNAGPEPAEGPITVVHSIGVDFELVSVAGSGWDCEHRRPAGTITCELDEDLGTGQRRRLGLVTSLAGVEPSTSIPGTMSVVAGTEDPDLGNNTVNVTASTAPSENDGDSRSRSTGAAGATDSGNETDTTVGATGASSSGTSGDQARAAAMEELPHTGSGLAAILGLAGIGMCLAGRRLMTWSARAQTRTLLMAANIG